MLATTTLADSSFHPGVRPMSATHPYDYAGRAIPFMEPCPSFVYRGQDREVFDLPAGTEFARRRAISSQVCSISRPTARSATAIHSTRKSPRHGVLWTTRVHERATAMPGPNPASGNFGPIRPVYDLAVRLLSGATFLDRGDALEFAMAPGTAFTV